MPRDALKNCMSKEKYIRASCTEAELTAINKIQMPAFAYSCSELNSTMQIKTESSAMPPLILLLLFLTLLSFAIDCRKYRLIVWEKVKNKNLNTCKLGYMTSSNLRGFEGLAVPQGITTTQLQVTTL